MNVFELLVLMVIGGIVLVPVVLILVVLGNRTSNRPLLPDFAPGSRVSGTTVPSRPGVAPAELTGRLVRTDNASVVVEVDGRRHHLDRATVRVSPDAGERAAPVG